MTWVRGRDPRDSLWAGPEKEYWKTIPSWRDTYIEPPVNEISQTVVDVVLALGKVPGASVEEKSLPPSLYLGLFWRRFSEAK
jgi:hypothetical protein